MHDARRNTCSKPQSTARPAYAGRFREKAVYKHSHIVASGKGIAEHHDQYTGTDCKSVTLQRMRLVNDVTIGETTLPTTRIVLSESADFVRRLLEQITGALEMPLCVLLKRAEV